MFLLPVDFVPFFGMALGAALRSLTYGRLLHKSFFEAKRMSPFQIELWITERQTAYRSFGFAAALMERMPLIGMVFSISNRIGAAMWAHDLEKRQQAIRASSTGSSSKPAIGSSSSTSTAPAAVGLEEYKSKPTLKKLYKNAQLPATADDPADGASFNGEGLAVLRRAQQAAVFTHLSFTFPLKLICPSTSSRNATLDLNTRDAAVAGETETNDASAAKAVSALYIVGYGGGLVSGDSVDLDVDVGSGCTLVVLTQGSTKVFKTRSTNPTRGVSTASFSAPRARADAEAASDQATTVGEGMTRQGFRFLVRKNSTLVLLPDPVTCFASARYDQTQRFDLRCRTSSSAIVLDWITPGRTAVPPAPLNPRTKLNHLDANTAVSSTLTTSGNGAMLKDYSTPQRHPERWAFHLYRSRNELRIASNVIARDVLLLAQQPRDTFVDPATGLEFTELARRNHPYGCYATLLLAGPDAAAIVTALRDEFEAIQQRPTTALAPEDVLWSLSRLEEASADGACVVRIAAVDAQSVRRWLHKRLSSLEAVIGRDLYRQALAS